MKDKKYILRCIDVSIEMANDIESEHLVDSLLDLRISVQEKGCSDDYHSVECYRCIYCGVVFPLRRQ